MAQSTSKRLVNWRRRKARVRRRVQGTTERPRLTVFRSCKHIYAQVIDDTRRCTLAAASTLDEEVRTQAVSKSEEARLVGELVARRCLAGSIEAVVFDRNGYPYNSGRVRSLAEGARSGGLKF
jgi:large subunit ribosomal protein L18